MGIAAAVILGFSFLANSFEMLIVGRLIAGLNAGILVPSFYMQRKHDYSNEKHCYFRYKFGSSSHVL